MNKSFFYEASNINSDYSKIMFVIHYTGSYYIESFLIIQPIWSETLARCLNWSGLHLAACNRRLTLKGWFVWFFYYVTMTFWASLFGTALEPGFLCLPDSPFFKCVFHLPWSKYDTCSSRHCICILRRKKRKDGWTVCLPFRSFLRSFPQRFCFSFHVVYLLLVSPDLLLPFSILLCALADWPVQTASRHPLPSGFQGKLQPRVLCEASGRYWKQMGTAEKSEVE